MWIYYINIKIKERNIYRMKFSYIQDRRIKGGNVCILHVVAKNETIRLMMCVVYFGNLIT